MAAPRILSKGELKIKNIEVLEASHQFGGGVGHGPWREEFQAESLNG
jgi:hypothetical protein